MSIELTENARTIIGRAEYDAGPRGSAGIDPVCLMRALVRDRKCFGCVILAAMGVDLDLLASSLLGIDAASSGTNSGKRVIDRAMQEARALKSPQCGSEHLLVALASETEGEFPLLLARHGINLNSAHRGLATTERPKRGAKLSPPSSLHSTVAAEPVGAYAHAKRVGNLLFLAGIGPRQRGQKAIPGVTLDSSGSVVSYDIEAQVRACFGNVRTILEEAGSSWDRIVDATVFLIDMKRDFPVFNRIWAEYFKENQPTRTTVQVVALPTPIAFEMKVIATV